MNNSLNFESIFRSSTPPCLVFQPTGAEFVIVDANERFLSILDRGLEEIRGKGCSEIFPLATNKEFGGPEVLVGSLRKVLKVHKADRISPVRLDSRPEGAGRPAVRYWSAENTPVFNEQGEVSLIVLSLQEVTEQVLSQRKQWEIQQELIRVQQQYEHFVQRNTDGLYSLDENGDFTSANLGLADMVELPLDELLKLNFRWFCYKDHGEKVEVQFSRVLSGESCRFEAPVVTASGKQLIVDISLVPIYVYGRIAGAYGIARDVTQMRHSEEILIEKRKFLQTNANFISRLLQKNLDQEDLQNSLAMIGKAVSVDRIYYVDSSTHPETGEVRYDLKIEWTNERSSPQRNNPLLQDMSLEQLQEYVGPLAKGEVFGAVRSELPEGKTKELMEMLSARSVLLLPIYLHDKMYGVVGFDDCRLERQWTEDEINFLKAVADNLTNTLERQAAEAAVKEGEEALRLSRQKFQAMVQEGSDLIGILDKDATYTFVSESTSRVLGIPPEEILGRKAVDFIHPEDLPLMREQYAALGKEKRVKLSPFRFRAQNAAWCWLETTVTDMIQDPAVQGVVINCRDVTALVEQAQEIKQISEESISAIQAKREELKVANKRFKMATKATNELIWDWDIVQDQVTRGSRFPKIYGYRSKSLCPNLWLSKIHQDDQERVQLSLEAALKNSSKKKWEEEYRFIKADGEMAYLVDRAYILRDATGKATRMVGSVLDITESKKALERIKEQNQLLKEIAWEQSHIVRAPLARLQGLVDLLDLDHFEEMSRAEVLKNILSSTDELDTIIRNIVGKTYEIDSRKEEDNQRTTFPKS